MMTSFSSSWRRLSAGYLLSTIGCAFFLYICLNPHRHVSTPSDSTLSCIQPVSSLFPPGCDCADRILICLALLAALNKVLITYCHSKGLTIITELFNRNESSSLNREGLPASPSSSALLFSWKGGLTKRMLALASRLCREVISDAVRRLKTCLKDRQLSSSKPWSWRCRRSTFLPDTQVCALREEESVSVNLTVMHS